MMRASCAASVLHAIAGVLFAAQAVPARAQDWRADVTPPVRVTVRPVFFVPRGAPRPTADQRARLARHVAWARERYQALLGTTFALDTAAVVVAGAQPASFYRAQTEDGVPDITVELLEHFAVSRFACPWVFVIVVMHPDSDWPTGGGRPINGGFNSGGGIVVLSSYALDRITHVQSTLRHELGHAFGLPHVDVYGLAMTGDSSLMSYNPSHHTSSFRDAARPGGFNAFDRAALAHNQRVFPGLTAPPAERPLVPLGPMELIGHPAGRITVTTPSGERYGSRVTNIVRGEVPANAGPGVTFDATRMWHSDSSAAGRVDVVFVMPVAVTLSRIALFTQHSGRYHAARHAQVWLLEGDQERLIAAAPLAGADAEVSFAPVRGRMWRVSLDAAERGMVTVRGVRFYGPAGEVFAALR